MYGPVGSAKEESGVKLTGAGCSKVSEIVTTWHLNMSGEAEVT